MFIFIIKCCFVDHLYIMNILHAYSSISTRFSFSPASFLVIRFHLFFQFVWWISFFNCLYRGHWTILQPAVVPGIWSYGLHPLGSCFLASSWVQPVGQPSGIQVPRRVGSDSRLSPLDLSGGWVFQPEARGYIARPSPTTLATLSGFQWLLPLFVHSNLGILMVLYVLLARGWFGIPFWFTLTCLSSVGCCLSPKKFMCWRLGPVWQCESWWNFKSWDQLGGSEVSGGRYRQTASTSPG